MNKEYIDLLLEKFEEEEFEANFENLVDFGAEVFSTNDLYYLLGNLEAKYSVYKVVKHITMILTTFSPIWIFPSVIFYFLSWNFLAITSFLMLPFTFLLGIGGLFYFNKNYFTKIDYKYLKSILMKELKERSY